MFDGIEITEIILADSRSRGEADEFLAQQGLRLDPLDLMLAARDADGRMAACAGLAGHTLKCVAVRPDMREHNLSSRLVSAILSRPEATSLPNINVYTKPANLQLFRSLGFHAVGEGNGAVMLESDRNGISRFLRECAKTVEPDGDMKPAGVTGAIVMNLNPLTLGHLHLIRTAADRCGLLYIFLLDDNPRTRFAYSERRDMLARAAKRIREERLAEGKPDCRIVTVPASDYLISEATFPSYFLKKREEATEAHVTLDLDIFSRRIAPALGIKVRFVGEEPTDALTAYYNSRMHELLPEAGIDVTEIPRLCDDAGIPYSASRVRDAIDRFNLAGALRMVPESSAAAVIGDMARKALFTELDLTPKPGLVDRHDSGAHTDMDHSLMARSIRAIAPFFSLMAAAPDSGLSRLGMDAEDAMLKATGGVNTYRGAIFSLGIACAAIHRAYCSRDLTPESVRRNITGIAQALDAGKRPSNGSEVSRKYGVPGALRCATEGYPQLFTDWLPSLKDTAVGEHSLLRLLLLIMSGLEDTNVYHRAGREGAGFVKRSAADALNAIEDGTTGKSGPSAHSVLSSLNKEFTARNISPGGAADMLSLTLLIHSACGNVNTKTDNSTTR